LLEQRSDGRDARLIASYDTPEALALGVPTRPRRLGRRHPRTRRRHQQAHELVELARRHGYCTEELIQILKSVT
jgi:hypothetical protein